MNDLPDKAVYLQFDNSSDRKQFLENAEKKYKDTPGFKKTFIDFILFNRLENLLGADIIISEPVKERQLKIHGFPDIRTFSELANISAVFEKLSECLGNTDPADTALPPSLFFRKGDTVAEIFNTENTNSAEISDIIDFDSDSFNVERSENMQICKARKSGYLVSSIGRLSISSPVVFSSEKTEVYVYYFPVIYRKNDLLDYIYNWFSQFSVKYPEAPFRELPDRKYLENSDANRFLAIKGNTAVSGRDASIEKLCCYTDSIADEEGRIDHRSFKRYTVVDKDQLLFRKFKKLDPVPGVDIYGNRIEVDESSDREIKAEGLIREESEGEYINYYSDSAGLFSFEENRALVEEVMIVDGNVDYRTGNIDFPNNVNIRGDVAPGFNVRSGKNVIVEGCLDNGSFVKCGGDLVVKNGIIGEGTRIECEGDVYANYFSEAELYCSGKTVIEKYMMGGSVFSEKMIEVHGNGIKKPEISSVFGGRYYSMGSISVHSAGNMNRSTLLCCGYNPYLDFKHRETVRACAAVDSEISGILNLLRGRYGITENPETAKNKTADEKRLIVEKLKKLKELNKTRNSLSELGNKILSDIYSHENSNISVSIQKYLIPVVEIQMIRDIQVIREKRSSEIFKLPD